MKMWQLVACTNFQTYDDKNVAISGMHKLLNFYSLFITKESVITGKFKS